MADFEVLGLDEIVLKKGQRDYVTLMTGRFRDDDDIRRTDKPWCGGVFTLEFPKEALKMMQRPYVVVCGSLY